MIRDAHHHGLPDPEAINNVRLGPENLPDADVPLSIGLHPWDTTTHADALSRLEDAASDPRVVAIGECGIDLLKGAPAELQETVFREHIRVSELLKKPLIIHAVRSSHIILRLQRELKPIQPWIIHGFRGNTKAAAQLHNAGIYTSIGSNKPEWAKQIPFPEGIDPMLILAETDMSGTLPVLPVDTTKNLQRIFP